MKVPVSFHSNKDDDHVNYMKHLTPYAYKFTAKQLDLKEIVKIPEDANDEQATISTSEGAIDVCCSCCECLSWKSMKLPCRHIFALRKHVGMDLFDPSLCGPLTIINLNREFSYQIVVTQSQMYQWSLFQLPKRKLCLG